MFRLLKTSAPAVRALWALYWLQHNNLGHCEHLEGREGQQAHHLTELPARLIGSNAHGTAGCGWPMEAACQWCERREGCATATARAAMCVRTHGQQMGPGRERAGGGGGGVLEAQG